GEARVGQHRGRGVRAVALAGDGRYDLQVAPRYLQRDLRARLYLGADRRVDGDDRALRLVAVDHLDGRGQVRPGHRVGRGLLTQVEHLGDGRLAGAEAERVRHGRAFVHLGPAGHALGGDDVRRTRGVVDPGPTGYELEVAKLLLRVGAGLADQGRHGLPAGLLGHDQPGDERDHRQDRERGQGRDDPAGRTSTLRDPG